jgi:hypothetical protein
MAASARYRMRFVAVDTTVLIELAVPIMTPLTDDCIGPPRRTANTSTIKITTRASKYSTMLWPDALLILSREAFRPAATQPQDVQNFTGR